MLPVSLNAPVLTGYQYLWSNGASTSSIQVTDSGLYYVNMQNGICTGSDSINVFKLEGEVLGKIPNIFTPNNDGLNDVFEFSGSDELSSFEISIYDRWGKRMFHTADFSQKWNGRFNDNLVPEGVYFYALTYESPCTEGKVSHSGHVQVLYSKK